MKRRTFALVAVLAVILTACDTTLLILTPEDGEIVDAATVEVTGEIPANYAPGGTLTVNGIPTAVNPDGSWSQTVPTVAGIVTPIEAIYDEPGGQVWRHRRAVVNGPSVPSGEYSADGVGMVFTNDGLDNMGPIIEDLAGGAFDIGGLLMSQNPIIEDEPFFAGVTADGSVYEAGIGGVGITPQSTAAGVVTDITIDDLFLGLDLDISALGIPIDCKLELQIDSTTISGTFDLEPDPADPSFVDVNLVGIPPVTTTGVSHEFIAGICDGDTFLLGDIVNALVPDMQDLIAGGFEENLGDPDGAGPLDSPIADAIEEALAEISIAGEVGSAVGVNLDAPFTTISESDTKITMQADADFFSTVGAGPSDCQPPADAPTLSSTYDVPGGFPAIPDLTPTGGLPYGLGLVISASSFNQLLGGMTECGQLSLEITELALFGGDPVPITSHLLAFMIPELAAFADVPAKLVVRPTAAPYISDSATGPNGEMAELVLPNLMIEAVGIYPNYEIPYLTLAMDAPLGLDLAYDPVAGVLAPTITPGPAGSADARVVTNLLNTDEPSVEALFGAMFPTFAGELSDTFSAFPLPSFLGLQLDILELDRDGSNFVLYGNLNNIPQTRIENAALTDLSSGDSVTDSIFDVNEWRHRIRDTFSSSTLDVHYMGMLGADAWSTLDDESRSATARYQLSFDVIAENGEAWQLDIGHNILGAHTLIDEKVAFEDAGGRSQFNSPVEDRVQVNGGAWQDFDFSASPGQVVHDLYGGEGDSNVQFSGSNNIVLNGTTAATITIEFEFDMYVKSNSNAWFPAAGGDEAALRFGAHDTIANGFTAGGYPGLGGRDIGLDGHFVNVTLSSS